MLTTLQKLFTSQQAQAVIDSKTLNLAAAALLTEVMLVDDKVNLEERTRLAHLLQHRFHIPADEVHDLIAQASREAHNAHDFYQFTRLINDHFSYTKKCHLLEALWQIAFADEELDKYEESTVRKIADLLYIEHADFIRCKKLAQEALKKHSLNN